MELIGQEELLQLVDEYELYCFYLEFQPDIGMKYTSPIRDPEDPDDSASWGIFKPTRNKTNREFMWKDQAKGRSGDIFELVKQMFRYRNKDEALARILSDFNMGPEVEKTQKVIKYVPKPASEMIIQVASKPFDKKDFWFWNQFWIDEPTLKMYNVTAIRMYWMTKGIEWPTYPKNGPGYAYRIWDKYKLYFPYQDKGHKFRNNFDDRHLEGFLQLKYNHPLLIITKAMKDVMMFRRMGYEAVAPRGEGTMIPEPFLRHFEEKYKKIIRWFDNDGKHCGDQYPYQGVEVPISSGQKDPTDFCRQYGPQETLLLTKTLTGYDPI